MKIKELHYLLYLSIGLLNVPLTTATFKIRLVNGPNQCAGRVEVFHDDSWGTVCDDFWSMNNGDVVCREMDCGTALEIKKSAQFGEGKGAIWMDDVKCTGKESSLSKCPKKDFGDNNCGHGEDAGVVCSENIRLINGTGRCSGRVEVRHNGQWRKVCDSGWGTGEAEVVCQQLSCGSPVTDQPQHFGAGSGMTGYTTSCFGNESSLAECKVQEFNQTCTDASVVCENNRLLRLVNGTSKCAGRVEVYHEGRWGSVCDDRWGMQEAEVVCRETDCGTPLAVKYRAYFGAGVDQVWLDDIECVGHESSLATCPHRGFGSTDCGHDEDAGVVCSDTVRLVNGTNRCSGRVEVNHAGHWGTICNSDWSSREATLMCKELDCGKPSSPPGRSQFGHAPGLRGYTTSCTGNENSITECSFQAHPARCEDVTLTCSGNPQMRLANGTDRCSGRLEIVYDGQWGTVCDNQWDIMDAEVLCKALDCGSAKQAKSRAFFGPGTGPIWWNYIQCVGNETSFAHCRRQEFGQNSCGHAEDAGVICSSNIRLINGDHKCSGRVEVYRNDQWSPVYEQNWGLSEVEVVCREMDCGDPVISPASSHFGRGSGATGYTVRCIGTEHSISQCSLRQFIKTSQDGVGEATVVCSGNVKLVNGSGPCAGRVEFYNEGQWGTVCSHSWGMNDAHVVCRQLNCGRAHAVKHMAYFGQGSGQVWIDVLECSGQEASLTLCNQRKLGDNTCNQTSAAGVICTESLEARLVNERDQCSGRVEVRHAGQWGTVCDQDWTMADAEVVCKLLECGNAVTAPGGAHFGQGTGPSWEASDSCFSSETSLRQCSLRGFNQTTCGHEKDAGVVCAEKLQLVNGEHNCSGRVEIFHAGQWGTVCDDGWGLRNAEVVCRQLGCGQAVSAPTGANFGRGTGPIWLDDVSCQGHESAITQCTHYPFGQNDCSHSEDTGVVCLGALEKPQISLSTASEVNWGDRVEFTCTVITQHLGGTFTLEKTPGSFRMVKSSDDQAVTFVLPKVDFDHSGSYSCQYRKMSSSQTINFPQGDPVKLSVAVRLNQPSISLTSSHAMVTFGHKSEVNKGSSFSITCSIHSLYPGGYFYLTKSNISITNPKPVFSHTALYLAYFEFVADSNVQGEYSCIYGIHISTRSFRSAPSETLTVTLTGSSASVVSGVLGGLLLLLLLLVVCYLVWRRRRLSGPAMVMFSKIVGRGAKEETGKGFGVLDDRDYHAPENEYGNGRGLEEKGTEENAVEKTADEDLTGRVSFDLEPLIKL